MKVLHCYVSGRVQGVFFRASTEQEARRLGLQGWVRNLPDGRVEVFAQGDQSSIEHLRLWLEVGPDHAQVDGLECVPGAKAQSAISGFRVTG